MNKRVKKVITIVTLAVLLSSLNHTTIDEKEKQEEVIDDDCYARYSKGKVYIGSKKYLKSIINQVTINDILVIDQRNNDEDPNMKIISSYRITDSNIRNEIIKILLRYEKEYPSKWKRSFVTMKREWFVHNFLYYARYQRHRTKDVDFNNDDESIYRIRK